MSECIGNLIRILWNRKKARSLMGQIKHVVRLIAQVPDGIGKLPTRSAHICVFAWRVRGGKPSQIVGYVRRWPVVQRHPTVQAWRNWNEGSLLWHHLLVKPLRGYVSGRCLNDAFVNKDLMESELFLQKPFRPPSVITAGVLGCKAFETQSGWMGAVGGAIFRSLQ